MTLPTDSYPGLTMLAREAMERTRTGLHPDIGATLFLAHYGPDGGLAYVSTCDRKDMIKTLVSWLRQQAEESSAHRSDVLAAFQQYFGPATPPRS